MKVWEVVFAYALKQMDASTGEGEGEGEADRLKKWCYSPAKYSWESGANFGISAADFSSGVGNLF